VEREERGKRCEKGTEERSEGEGEKLERERVYRRCRWGGGLKGREWGMNNAVGRWMRSVVRNGVVGEEGVRQVVGGEHMEVRR